MDALPVELLQEIFSYFAVGRAVDTLRSDVPPATPEIEAAWSRLAAACHLWRDVAYKTPERWSFIQLNGPVDESKIARLQLHLERSGEHPLDVWVQKDERPYHYYFYDEEDAKEDAEGRLLDDALFFRWLQLVQQHAHRWRRVRLQLPHKTPIAELLVLTRSMPLLREIVLVPDTGTSGTLIHHDWENMQKQGFLNQCPRLQSLTSHVSIIVPTQVMVHLQYLSFSLRTAFSDSPLWATLAMTPNLQKLDIYFPKYWSAIQQATPPEGGTLLPALRHLGVYGFPSPRDSDWINHLRMPQLDTLTAAIEPLDHLQTVFNALCRQVRHLIITTAEKESSGYYCDSDVRSLELLETLDVLELHNVQPGMFLHNDQSFFESLLEGCTRDPPTLAAQFARLIIRDSCLYLHRCESLAAFVRFREEAAEKDGGIPFAFELVNSKIKKLEDKDPPSFLSHFQGHIADSLIDSTSVSGDSDSEYHIEEEEEQAEEEEELEEASDEDVDNAHDGGNNNSAEQNISVDSTENAAPVSDSAGGELDESPAQNDTGLQQEHELQQVTPEVGQPEQERDATVSNHPKATEASADVTQLSSSSSP